MLKAVLKTKFLTDTIWTFSATLIVGVSGLLLQTLVNNKYSAVDLGVYAQVTSFYTLFSAVCYMGVGTSTVKFISEDVNNLENCKSILSSALCLVFLSSIFTLCIICAVYSFDIPLFSSREVAESFKYIIGAIPLFAINKIFFSAINSFRNMRQYAFCRMLRWILVVVFTIVFSLIGKDLKYCVLAYVFSESVLFAYFLFFRFGGWIQLRGIISWVYRHLKYGLYGLFMAVIAEINTNVMVLISGYYLQLEEVAIISFVMSFARAISMVNSAVQLNFNPLFAKAHKEGRKKELEMKIKRIYQFTKISSIPLLVVVTMSYHLYTNWFMTGNLSTTTVLFSIVSIGTALTFLSQWNSSMLIMAGQFKGEMFRVLSVFIIKLFITFTLTRYWGIIGNLLAFTLVEVYSLLINMFLVKRILGYNLFNYLTIWERKY